MSECAKVILLRLGDFQFSCYQNVTYEHILPFPKINTGDKHSFWQALLRVLHNWYISPNLSFMEVQYIDMNKLFLN